MLTTSLYKYTLISLVNFVLAAIMGLVLRYAFIGEIPFNFNHLLHAHSHIAALGWAYQMLCTFIVFSFVKVDSGFYNKLFWLTQISVVGMMFSFPFQGYGTVSILFSALHIICSYIFIIFIRKNATYNSTSEKLFLRAALVFLFISTLGIWMLAPSIVLYGKNSLLYQISIQFYLHFQFSGWFIFATLALLMRFFFKTGFIIFRFNFTRAFLYCFITTVPLGFSLVLFWFYKNDFWFYVNGIAVLIQFLILLIFIIKSKINITLLRGKSATVKWFLILGLMCLVIKIIFQTTTISPKLALLSHQIRNFSVGYIHLIMLGFVTSILFVFAFDSFKNKKNVIRNIGLSFFIVGFISSEVLLFLQGVFYSSGLSQITYYNEFLFSLSGLIVVAILLLTFDFASRSNKEITEFKN